MNRVIIAVCSLAFAIDVCGMEIPIRFYEKKIVLSQKDCYLSMPWDFSVTEDGGILLSDLKDQKIVFYRKDGTILASWKKNGQGPGEFLAAWFNDYENPFFGLYDSRQSKLLLYRRESEKVFNWERDLAGINPLTWGVMIYRNRIYFDSSLYADGKRYCIYSYDLNGKDQKQYLPAEIRYGLKEGDDWKKVEPRYQGIWGLPRSYMYLYGDFIYSAWIGDDEIQKININNGKITNIGERTEYYKRPDYDYKIGSGRRDPNAIKEYSWITGLFADRSIIGLLANRFDKSKERWNVLLQTFDESGNVLKEEILEGIAPPERSLCYCYCRTDGSLYVLNEEDNGDDTNFVIYQYKIRK